jgi:putative DNA primase/helicase
MIAAAHIESARGVRIEDELSRRGIKLRGRVDRFGPCPQCGGEDRFSINLRKQVFHCRGCGGKGGGSIDLAMFLDGCDFNSAVTYLAGEAPERTDYSIPKQPASTVKKSDDNRALARGLWERRRPVTQDCPVGLYLRKARGYGGPIPATLGYLPANGKHSPAMIAAFGFCEEPEPGVIDPPANVTGVHITRLRPDGRKAPEDKPKIMLGPMSGLPIVLAPANDGLGLAITEGIEDGLSVLEETGLGVWAAGSAGNMPKIAAALPAYVECVTIFAHCDENGLRFAKEAARLIAAIGVEVHLKGLSFHPVETPLDIGPLEGHAHE